MYKHINKILLMVGLLLLLVSACRKFVEVGPPSNAVVAASAYNSNATAAAAVNGIYITMRDNAVGGGAGGISALLGLSADEFQLYPGAVNSIFNEVYINALRSNNLPSFWSNLYSCLYQANVALDNLAVSSGVTPLMKQQLTGEVKFVRAFCLFYLINIYGDVPLATSSNYEVNRLLARTPAAEVSQQAIADLQDAQSLLSDEFLTPGGGASNDRVRPNKGAATALLARLYLFTGDYVKAEVEATKVIADSSRYKLLPELDKVFLANSGETIWQLQLPNNGFNTNDGSLFASPVLNDFIPDVNNPISLSDSLIHSFEASDQRKMHWVANLTKDGKTWYFPFKYKLHFTGAEPAEYPTILRLAEQYLIRAEARAMLNRVSDAAADLNTIRVRAGLESTTAITQAGILLAIEKERRLELFSEYGHRWLDLKRTGRVNEVMSSATMQKGGTWSSNARLYPIPLSEIQFNHNLSQNPGYTN